MVRWVTFSVVCVDTTHCVYSDVRRMCRGLYDDQTPEEQLARLTREEKTTGVEPRADIDAVSVTTVAGRNFYGADARVSALGDRDPNGEIGLCISSICHAPGRGDSLLIADDRRYQTIHAVYPAATEKRALNRVLTTVLIKTDALPVLPVISVITDYVTESTSDTPSRFFLALVRRSLLIF